MRHSILMAGISLLAISGPVLAGNPTPPNNVRSAPGVQLAQVQVQVPSASTPTAVVTTPGTSPSAVTSTSGSVPASTTVVVTAPTAPPPAQAETPPPAPGPRYVWAQGHWSWTARSICGTPAATSYRQPRSRVGHRDIGNKVQPAGSGPTAAGTKTSTKIIDGGPYSGPPSSLKRPASPVPATPAHGSAPRAARGSTPAGAYHGNGPAHVKKSHHGSTRHPGAGRGPLLRGTVVNKSLQLSAKSRVDEAWVPVCAGMAG